MVWDGAQLLWAIGAPPAAMEQDTGLAPVLIEGNTHASFFPDGRVACLHGLGIDEPRALTRFEYSDSLPGPLSVLPQRNWQGHHDGGIFPSTKRCKTITNSTQPLPDSTPENGGSEPAPGRDGSYAHCVEVDWPAKRMWSTMERRREMLGPVSWMGSLVEHQRDQTGQVYQRNRYYDPQTGRFTQEDPFGLCLRK